MSIPHQKGKVLTIGCPHVTPLSNIDMWAVALFREENHRPLEETRDFDLAFQFLHASLQFLDLILQLTILVFQFELVFLRHLLLIVKHLVFHRLVQRLPSTGVFAGVIGECPIIEQGFHQGLTHFLPIFQGGKHPIKLIRLSF